MVGKHAKNLTDQVNEILKDVHFFNKSFLFFSIIFIGLSIYFYSIPMLLVAIAFLVAGWMVKLIAYLRCITLGQISQLAYMESRDKE